MVTSNRAKRYAPATQAPVPLQRQAMAAQVADVLRQRILAGEIAEGVQLIQEEVAAEFGISKVPIREAIYQLEAEGLVVQQFHRGAIVSGLSPKQIMELFELRAQIEGWLVELGMKAASEEDVRAARDLAVMFAKSKDPVTAWDLNWRFHESMYKPAHKPFIIDHLKKLHSQTARYVRMQYSIALNKDQIVREHAELTDLYAKRDPRTVEHLKKHILGAAEQLTRRLTQVAEERVGSNARQGDGKKPAPAKRRRTKSLVE